MRPRHGRRVRMVASPITTYMKSVRDSRLKLLALNIVCRTACSLYLSVLRHNVILNIQLNQVGRNRAELCALRTIPPLMRLPFDLATHSFFVNQATTRHNISENRCCAYIVRCTWSSIVIVLRLFLNYPAIHRHGCLWKWDMGHGCPVSNGSGNYHYVYEKS